MNSRKAENQGRLSYIQIYLDPSKSSVKRIFKRARTILYIVVWLDATGCYSISINSILRIKRKVNFCEQNKVDKNYNFINNYSANSNDSATGVF